jgi:hypothetical protein
MIGGGHVTAEEFERDLTRLDEEDFRMPSPILWAAWGRRPIGDENNDPFAIM